MTKVKGEFTVKRFIKRLRKQGGFTLIELLVVIAILGILAAVIVPSVTKYIGSSQVAALNVEVSAEKTAIVSFMADNKGKSPTNQSDLGPYLDQQPNMLATYTWDASGKITAGTYAGYTLDVASLLWKQN